MVASAVLGFPRIGAYLPPGAKAFRSKAFLLAGANREVKKAVEAYWANTITADQLTQVAADVKKSNWTSLKSKGVDYVPRSVRFSFSHVLISTLTNQF
jgi:5-methyltetrahydropteroyltriglutamate--homocysteine methyltransferase